MSEQGSQEWLSERCGMVTASRIKDVMASIKTGEAAARRNYRMELLCERLTGQPTEFFISGPMQRGTEMEPIAVSSYEIDKGVMTEETGFVLHPSIKGLGASPDRLVGEDGLIEVKCPNTATHIDFLVKGKINPDYEWQMVCQMVCTGRAWCDFVSFDDRLPSELSYKCVRYDLDAEKAAAMIQEVIKFIAELDALEDEMKSMMEEKINVAA